MDRINFESEQGIHELGVTYVHDLLDRVGFTIQEVNKDPEHHYQLLVRIKNRAMLIAIRTAHSPEVGTLDKPMKEKLIEEAKRLNAVPHFAGISLTSKNESDIQNKGLAQVVEDNIIFNGMTVVR